MTARITSDRIAMVLASGFTLFLTSALIFLIQPLAAKHLLPLVGGSPALWDSCMVFFQSCVLLGYLYAHLLARWVPRQWQASLHLAMLCAAVSWLPGALIDISPSAHSPYLWTLAFLWRAVGPTVALLAGTSPLIQLWFREQGGPDRPQPLFLYALGNIGSLTALASYPLWVESHLTLGMQYKNWVAGCWTALVLILVTAFILGRLRRPGAAAPLQTSKDATRLTSPVTAPSFAQRTLWLAVGFLCSSLMLGLTSFTTIDIAAVPMLWIAPLFLYMLAFALVFACYPPRIEAILQAALPWLVFFLLAMAQLVLADLVSNHFMLVILLQYVLFFPVMAACLGRLVTSAPTGRYLTEFYAWIAVGGVLGGVFNAFIAPLLFDRIVEYPLMLGVLLFFTLRPDTRFLRGSRMRQLFFVLFLIFAIYGMYLFVFAGGLAALNPFAEKIFSSLRLFYYVVIFGVPLALAVLWSVHPHLMALTIAAWSLWQATLEPNHGKICRYRSFYGISSVNQRGTLHTLLSGAVIHGWQDLKDEKTRMDSVGYYQPSGPIGQTMRELARRGHRVKVAVLGMGAGAMAVYGSPSLALTFYEINPDMVRIATNPRIFTYLSDCLKRSCPLAVVEGDGRLQMAQSVETYDFIAVDAFLGDAIPTHLLTREAMEVYLSHLNPQGIVAFHISNRYINLEPVLYELGQHLQLYSAIYRDAFTWAFFAKSPDMLAHLRKDAPWDDLRGQAGVQLWRDDYVDLISVLDFSLQTDFISRMMERRR